MVAAIGIVHEGSRLCRGWGSFPSSYRPRPYHPRKISRRGNRYLRVLFVQAAWVVLIKPKTGTATGQALIEAARKRLHHNGWR